MSMLRAPDHQWDPTRRTISVGDPRLNMLFVRSPDRCASLTEYAQAAGMDTAQVIDLLGPYLDDGTLALEFVGDEVFVHTAPNARPAPREHADVPPNLWERLRSRSTVEMSYAVWRLVRSMERSGWGVETNASKILFGLGPLQHLPYFAVQVGPQLVSVLPFPSTDEVASVAGGLLTEYAYAGSVAVALVCDESGLDEMCTAARRWVLAQSHPPTMSILILEAPRYNPVLIAPSDGAVTPVAVSRTALFS
jgi:hypothetical protein